MLREIKSNLKTLKFGKDQPDGGSSGLPYIKSYDNNQTTQDIARETARFSSDYPIRGGLYSVRAAAEDAIRVRKFLTDFPKGSNFTSKQVGLQKSNPLSETGKNGGRINTQTYNLNSNLLLSVLTAGTGTHYPRPGATPLTLLDPDNKYFSIVGKKETEDNRLVTLYKSKILGEEIDQSKLENLGISNDEFQIFNYLGGPGSTYGEGETVMFKATDHKGVAINTNKAPKSSLIPLYISSSTTSSLGSNKQNPGYDISGFIKDISPSGSYDSLLGIDGNGNIFQPEKSTSNVSPFFNTLTYNQLKDKESVVVNGVVTNTLFNDFRLGLPSGSSYTKNYKDNMVPMTTRIGIGAPGSRTRNMRTNTNTINKDGQDKVNMSPIYYGNFEKNTVEKDPNTRDLIKFAFETIDNDNPNNTYRTHFRAYLKGFTDNNSADWNSKKYAGRGENIYNYQGFDRTISFNFIVIAQSKQEMKPLWQKLNYLNSTLSPDYDLGTGFMRGNITRLTIGEYLYRTPGVLKSLNFSIDDNYTWEIKMDEPEGGKDNDMMELPQAINVSVTFAPILHTLPRTITRNDYNVPSLISENIGDIENFIRDKNPFQVLLGKNPIND